MADGFSFFKNADAEILRLVGEAEAKDAMIADLREKLSAETQRTAELKAFEANIIDLQKELSSMRSEIEQKDAVHAQKMAEIEETKRRLKEQEEILMSKKDCYEKMLSNTVLTEDRVKLQNRPFTDSIIHIDIDELYSVNFKAERYSVSVTADGKMMKIRESPKGRVVCRNSTLLITDLERFLPFTEKRELKSVAKDDTFTVELKAAYT